MTESNKYRFSFTATSLRNKEMVLVAKARQEGSPFDYVNELGNGKEATGKRMLREIETRLETLTDLQMELLIFGDLETQKSIAFLAVCKTYAFIRDFVVEVLREKSLVFDYDLTEGDYITFFRRKNEQHPEMDEITEKTTNKVKQVCFRILEQSGLINNIKERTIQPQLLDSTTINAISQDNPDWLKVFLYSDMDIVSYAE